MAYSNLGINLLTTGSEAGNWGNITNDNFNLFDSAIVGAATLTLTTTSTTGLNVADGAASTGRNRIVTISSAGDIGGTGNVQITPADFVGYYFIRNSLASNRSVIISQGTGATTVTVENGKDVIVRCDGANNVSLVLANPAFTSVKTDSLTSKTGTFTNSTVATTQEANLTSGSTTVTLTASNASILVGMRVTGTNIPANTSVVSNSGTTLVISNAASGTLAGVTLTFYTIALVTSDTLAVYGQVTNALSMGTNRITNLGTPTATTDATTKTYVDTAVSNAAAASPSNLIINGSMQVAQRATSTNQAPNGTFITDRFVWNQLSAGVGKVDTSRSSAGSVVGAFGIRTAARIIVDTADTSIGSTDYYYIGYAVEGYDASKIRGSTFTLSFWVNATLAGVYSVAFRNRTLTYSYVTTFEINTADNWEFKTITVTGGLNTTYFTETTSNAGVYISWCMAASSSTTTYSTSTLNSYVSGNKIRATSQTVNIMATANNNFYLTGVQLELGATASNFQLRTYAEELALCQRYYNAHPDIIYGCVYGSTASMLRWFYPTTMRTNPSLGYTPAAGGTLTSTYATPTSAGLYITGDTATYADDWTADADWAEQNA